MRARTYFHSFSFGALVAAVGALIALMVWIASELAPSLSFELRPTGMVADHGSAYLADIGSRETWLYKVESDGPDGGDASRLRLFEGRWELGPSHAPHAEIRSKGNGRLSHWNGQLWFAASDSSDPRTNGRTYRVEVTQSVKKHWLFLGILAGVTSALIVLSWALAGLGTLLRSRNAPPWLARPIAGSLTPRMSGVTATLAIVAGGAVLGGCATVLGWYVGDNTTTGLGVLRYFPISDAFGYHSCGTNVAAGGAFDEPFMPDWCGRRTIYPMVIAGLLALTGWSSQGALILQGILVGASIAAFTLVLTSIWGLLAALVAAAILSVYAWEFVLGLYMTEFSGFVLGLAGLSLLISHCSSRRHWHLLVGAAFISIGMASRAGAVFALPAIVVWSAVAVPGAAATQRIRLATATAVAASAGLALQFFLAVALGADPSNTGGNFSTSLYGLSTGSRDWSQAYRDFAADFTVGEQSAFRKVYAVALANIVEHPNTFFGALFDATRLYFSSMFYFGPLESYWLPPIILFGIGILRSVIDWRSSLSKLVLALGIAELVAAPFIVDSGGIRVFAATVGVRTLFCAVGLHWCLSHIVARLGISPGAPGFRSAGGFPASMAAGPAALTVALVLIPLTPIGWTARLASAEGGRCPSDLREVVARVGHETQYMVISDRSAKVHSMQPFDVGLGRLQEDTRLRATWWGADFLALVPPVSIVRAVDLSSKHHAAVKPLFYRGTLSEQTQPISMCVDDNSFIELAGVKHYEIRRMVGPR